MCWLARSVVTLESIQSDGTSRRLRSFLAGPELALVYTETVRTTLNTTLNEQFRRWLADYVLLSVWRADIFRGMLFESKRSRIDQLILTLALVLLFATPGLAQPQAPSRTEIAAGAAFRLSFSPDCELNKCSFGTTGWWVSPAYYVTERIAVVGEAAGSYGNVDDLAPPIFPVAFDTSVKTHSFGGGIRVTGSRVQRVIPFVQGIISYDRNNASVAALGLRQSMSFSGVGFDASGGVDIGITSRAAIRVVGGYGIGRSEGESTHELGVGAGLVFGMGGRR